MKDLPEYVPDEDKLGRYVSPAKTIRNPDTDALVGIWPAAFELRPTDGNELSSAWVEFYSAEINPKAACMIGFTKSISVKSRGAFAFGVVSEIKAACSTHGCAVRIVTAPEEDHRAHVLVRRFKDDLPLLELLASEAWADLISASDCVG